MTRKSKLEKFKDELIASYLLGQSSVELGIKYNISYVAVLNFLRKQNIILRNNSQSNRKFKLIENFFDSIDTQEKAYFLGLLYADGCNSPEKNSVRLVLTATDKKLLEYLSKLIFIDPKPLSFRKGKIFTDKGKQYFRKDSYCLNINNKHISETLITKGLTKAKSFTITFPYWLRKDLISHFIRGYFDGDGSIGLSIKKQISISILGTELFCNELQKQLHELHIKTSICHAKKYSRVKQLIIHGNTVGRIFLQWLYKDSIICLDRKYNKYKEILNIIPPLRQTKCNVCDEKHYSQGYCKKHHYEFIGKKERHERYLSQKNSG